MTKTLTEQWREGTLPQGNYYIVIRGITEKKRIMIDYYIPELHHFEIKPSDYILEVLDAVPSYDEIKRLQAQLNEANEIISTYRCYDDTKCGKATEYCKKWGIK